MRPQISLKLIFSFSFSCQGSHNSGKEAGWRGFCWTHFSAKEVERRKGLWPGFNKLLHFFPQQNTPTAPHAFYHQDVVPPLAAGHPDFVNPYHRSRTISSNIRGTNLKCRCLCTRAWSHSPLCNNSLSGVIQLWGRTTAQTQERFFQVFKLRPHVQFKVSDMLLCHVLRKGWNLGCSH